ncbi:diacylglycerol kinase delta-like isoform X2 [Lampetra planeri]
MDARSPQLCSRRAECEPCGPFSAQEGRFSSPARDFSLSYQHHQQQLHRHHQQHHEQQHHHQHHEQQHPQLQHHQLHAAAAAPESGLLADDSSESETESSSHHDHDHHHHHHHQPKLIRKVSTSGQIRSKTSVREGFLMKQTSSFQRWKRRYFKLRGRTLYYAKDAKSIIFDEVNLTDASVAECSTKNANNNFTIITPFRRLILCADSRKEMEDWIAALKSVQSTEPFQAVHYSMDHFSGAHHWYACTHARPTYCNVCREALSGVTSHGLSCEVCKFKAHKRCAVRATSNCKWTTLASVGKDIIEDEDGLAMAHQWLEGNLPVSARCVVCDKACGSVLRLQDRRCLWCKAMVHSACREHYSRKCPLGQCKVSIIPPTALNSIDSDGFWKATCPPSVTSPLLVFVNSKSGDNQGVKFLRRFKQLLNPAQVFDLMNGGPHLGLRLFHKFDTFRILVCGGDGSVGWVLSDIDQLSLHKQCQMGVLPLGTGNDLARVLGWGHSCDDDATLPQILEKLERAGVKMLDRWAIMSYEVNVPTRHSQPVPGEERSCDGEADGRAGAAEEGGREGGGQAEMAAYEGSVAAHLTRILNSEQHSVVIASARVLCETVKGFVARVGSAYETAGENPRESDAMAHKCAALNEKLDSLLTALNDEARAAASAAALGSTGTPPIAEEEETEQEEEDDDGDGEEVEEEEELEKGSREGARRETCEGRHRKAPLRRRPRPPPLPALATAVAAETQLFLPREHLMSRANSLKKAVRQIIEQAERAVDEQNAQTSTCRKEPEDVQEEVQEDVQEEVEEEEAAGLAEAPRAGGTEPTGGHAHSGDEDSSPRSSPRSSFGSRLSNRGDVPAAPTERRISKTSAFLGGSLPTTAGPGSGKENLPMLNMRILYPSLRAGLAASVAGSCIISKMLLTNADTLGACATPLMDLDPDSLEGFMEKCVMNNYFGIGLDAKISLDFNNKREEHPEKCRSRTKNMMWYGVLGTKELLQQSFKNLDQRVLLECDGQYIPLPSLQGIAVLNIPSYAGGTNFWGGTKEDETFTAPSFDDKILEVVAVFSSMQMAVSRVLNLQHHRIAQCRTVKITILGEEGMPVQVDGEAWIQPPGYIKITHKNRAQMLTRDRAFESTLKSWEDKQKYELPRPHSQHALLQATPPSEVIMAEEANRIEAFACAAAALIHAIREAAEGHSSVEQELAHAVNASAHALDALYGKPKRSSGLARHLVMDSVNNVKALHGETELLLSGKLSLQLEREQEDSLHAALAAVDLELRRIADIPWLRHMAQPSDGEIHAMEYSKWTGRSAKFRLVPKFKRDKNLRARDSRAGVAVPVHLWCAEEVGGWLERLGLDEYRDAFGRNDIRGPELLQLDRRDLKDLGVTKIGHIKRILHGIKELSKHAQVSEV